MRLLLTISSIGVTALAYAFSWVVGKRYPSPLTWLVFFSTPLVIEVALRSGMHFSDHRPTKDIIASLVGPSRKNQGRAQKKLGCRPSIEGFVGRAIFQLGGPFETRDRRTGDEQS